MPLDSPKTILYLIRHGEPAPEFKDRFYGQLDVPLSERGIRQSHAVAERLASIPFDAIYSSDLQRAKLLADALGEKTNLPVREAALFRERNMGVLQGVNLEEFQLHHPEAYAEWRADRVYHKVEGGENWEDMQNRIVPAVQELVETFPSQRVALVSHAGVIRVLLAHVLGMPLSHIFQIVLDYACVNVVEFPQGDKPRVKMVNG